jgi:hypothetical protein
MADKKEEQQEELVETRVEGQDDNDKLPAPRSDKGVNTKDFDGKPGEFVGVDPIYQNYASHLQAPLEADEE